MTPTEEIAVTALGQADALFTPMRHPRDKHWGAAWYLRWRYRRTGLPYRSGRGKEGERLLTEAVEEGLIIRRRGIAKTTALILTRTGLARAWALIGYSPWCDLVVAEEVERQALALGADEHSWVPEVAFSGGLGWGDGRQDELRIVELTNLAALTSGLVESNCSGAGHVAYRRTHVPLPDAPSGWRDVPDGESDKDADEAYGIAFRESLQWLEAQTSESIGARGEIGAIPLSESNLGLRHQKSTTVPAAGSAERPVMPQPSERNGR